jgi:hypothetical protein
MADVDDDPWAAANRAVRELLSLNLIGVPDGEMSDFELAGDPPEFVKVPKVPLEIALDAAKMPAAQLFPVAE